MVKSVEPISGWMLDLAVAIDEHTPGFASKLFRASNERRQVIAAFCASSRDAGVPTPEAARFLEKARHHEILKAGYGDCPTGFRGALARSGSQLHDPRFYRVLHRLLSKPPHDGIAATISRLHQIDLRKLRVVAMLPQEMCSAEVVEALREPEVARNTIKVVELLVAHGVNRVDLVRAVREAGSREKLSRLWKRWAVRCRFPEQPVSASDGYRPIETADELRRLARRYRNCAMRYLVEALDGYSAFGEFGPEDGEPPMVVHMRQRSGRWEIDGFFLKANGRPDHLQRMRAREFLASAGIRERERERAPDGPWSSLLRYSSPFGWDLDDLEGLP